MIYAYASLMSGVPFGNGAPNLTVDIPALLELAIDCGVPVCGKDFKTGQTLMKKTIIAPALKARQLGLHGWFSTNILGNRDGDVLHDPDSFRTKERSKLSVPRIYSAAGTERGSLRPVRAPGTYPLLQTTRDNKEGWDNIDISFGWLDYPMQIKMEFPMPR